MMKITGNQKIAEKTYFMSLEGDTSAITKPGQFVNIKLDGFFLRRPISVCDCEEGKLSIIYKVVGNGTKKMSELPVGDELDILSGLGNGYDTSKSGEKPVLIGGGAGVRRCICLQEAGCRRQKGNSDTRLQLRKGSVRN